MSGIGDLKAALAIERELGTLQFAVLLGLANDVRRLERKKLLTEAEFSAQLIALWQSKARGEA